ncbi:MAG: hypothetical protein AB1752_01860 [Candidatus Zixiibacteriota bacterium]
MAQTHRKTLAWLLPLALFMAGCAATPPPIQEAAPGPTSADRLRLAPKLFESGVGSNRVAIAWTVDRNGSDILRGYNIYVSEDSTLPNRQTGDEALAGALYGGTHYPGDTDGDIRRESITIEDLSTGSVYYLHVRIVFPDGSESLPSNQIQVVPRPRGVFALVPRFEAGHDGFSFADDMPVEGTSEQNDLYMYVAEGDVFLASPDRLDRSLHVTRFVDLGSSGSLDEHPVFPGEARVTDRISVEVGRSIGVVLANGTIAKLRPSEIDLGSDPPRLTLEYLYQPRRGERRF